MNATLKDLLTHLSHLYDNYGDLPIYSLNSYGHHYAQVAKTDLQTIKVLPISECWDAFGNDIVVPERIDILLNYHTFTKEL